MVHHLPLLGWAKDLLRACGFELLRVRPAPLPPTPGDIPDRLLDATRHLGRSLLADVPLRACREAVGIGFDGHHPVVEAARLLEHDRAEARDALADFYHAFQPATAADVLGVPAKEAPTFARHPPLGYILPWEPGTPEDRLAGRTAWFVGEAARENVRLTIQDGANAFGPVSSEKLDLEFLRIQKVYESIRDRGYVRDDSEDGDVYGWLLTQNDGTWCVVLDRGLHRAAAAMALGYDSLPVRFKHAPVRREGLHYWPQVRAGHITPDGARATFDRVMAGEPPRGCAYRRPSRA